MEKIHRVPHITLFGNFDADYKEFKEITEIFESVSRKYSCLQYLIDGFSWLEGDKGKVIYYNVVPSSELECFRLEIATKFEGIVHSDKPWDRKKDFLFHSTVAYKLTNSEFKRTWASMRFRRCWVSSPRSPPDIVTERYLPCFPTLRKLFPQLMA
ncbi:MAG: 2'-5' RNA ligase family protein [Candidatus Bathyarchaeia archaeon]